MYIVKNSNQRMEYSPKKKYHKKKITYSGYELKQLKTSLEAQIPHPVLYSFPDLYIGIPQQSKKNNSPILKENHTRNLSIF